MYILMMQLLTAVRQHKTSLIRTTFVVLTELQYNGKPQCK